MSSENGITPAAAERKDDPSRAVSGQPVGCGDVIKALEIAADSIAGMGMAAARINLIGYLSEGYGAAETEVRQLVKQIQNGEEIEDLNGLKHNFGPALSPQNGKGVWCTKCEATHRMPVADECWPHVTPQLLGSWQPIEAAPRDGTRILARGGGMDDIEVVAYLPHVGAWSTPHYTLDDRDDEPDGYNRPRFWMPLPGIEPLGATLPRAERSGGAE